MWQFTCSLIKNYSAILIQWTLTYPATTGPDHGQVSEIARYVKHHTNLVNIVSLLALLLLFLSLLSIVGTNNRRISASPGFGQSKFQHIHLFKRSSITTLLCVHVQRSRLDSLSSRVVEVWISEVPLYLNML